MISVPKILKSQLNQPELPSTMETIPLESNKSLILLHQQQIETLKQQIRSLVTHGKSIVESEQQDNAEIAELTKTIKILKSRLREENGKNSILLDKLKSLQRGWLPDSTLNIKKTASERQIKKQSQVDSGVWGNKSGVRMRSVLMPQLPKILSQFNKSSYSLYFEGQFNRSEQLFWQKDVLSGLDPSITQQSLRDKLITFINDDKKFIAEKYRHLFWPILISDLLHINEKLFYGYHRNHTDPQLALRIKEDIDNLITHPHPEVSALVLKDLTDCLLTFCSQRPDFPYSSAFVPLMWMFIIRMEKSLAFRCFANFVLKDPLLTNILTFRKGAVTQLMSYTVQLVKERRPKAYQALQMFEGQFENVVLLEWLYSLFSICLPLGAASKVWDLWIAQGYGVFFKTCTALVQLLEPKLLQGKQVVDIKTFREAVFQIEEVKLEKSIRKQKLFRCSLPFS